MQALSLALHAIAAPNCYKFCMQALSLALQSRANLFQILHASSEFGTAVAAPICYKFCMQALSLALQLQRQDQRI
jgi:hypothetical protein